MVESGAPCTGLGACAGILDTEMVTLVTAAALWVPVISQLVNCLSSEQPLH